jgi:hypothetical protein
MASRQVIPKKANSPWQIRVKFKKVRKYFHIFEMAFADQTTSTTYYG